eukprot:CAMPEP_0115490232 /NCGR_PEP_ID=MMETSP0271-20121206/62442_1 /TAXON_ID=71861 /ORGANISM="Scrippsiella trochoidea, Strain CCMP3099" /LENGTH=180 /DNA_ID=CAMNT_0002918461 /DNA_START=616 /DNA_END=1158 /DNA_ORIENTATION=-
MHFGIWLKVPLLAHRKLEVVVSGERVQTEDRDCRAYDPSPHAVVRASFSLEAKPAHEPQQHERSCNNASGKDFAPHPRSKTIRPESFVLDWLWISIVFKKQLNGHEDHTEDAKKRSDAKPLDAVLCQLVLEALLRYLHLRRRQFHVWVRRDAMPTKSREDAAERWGPHNSCGATGDDRFH